MNKENKNIKQDIEATRKVLEEKGSYKTYFITTFGCQMNAHDSEKLSGTLIDLGLTESETEEEADIVVYNTCCVRENEENRVYGHLGYLKHIKESENPDMLICVCGCMMQQEHVLDTIKEKHRHVDVIFGTHNLAYFPELIKTRLETGKPVIDIWEKHKDIDELGESMPHDREFPFKSGVNITYGCDNFCTYCVVPFVRGRERSRGSAEIIEEIEALVDDGVIEVMLLGQNVNSYGKGLEENIAFPELLDKVAEIEGLERIRFMTSHPKDLSDELIEVMAKHDNICKHIHLPIQSGSTKVLKEMNRGYSREDYLTLVDKIRTKMPDIPMSTDIIVGFPGETEEDFAETLSVVEACKFSTAYTFYYSPRVGTPAAKREQVPEEVSKVRFDTLMDTLNAIVKEQNEKMVGQTIPVLVEGENDGEEGLLTGRGEGYELVHFKGDSSLIGTIVDVDIKDCMTFYLMGEVIE